MFFTYECCFLPFSKLFEVLTTYLSVYFWSYFSIRSRNPRNCEKITTLSSFYREFKCSINARILVLANISDLWLKLNLSSRGRCRKSYLMSFLLHIGQKPCSYICLIRHTLQNICKHGVITGSSGLFRQNIHISKVPVSILAVIYSK